MTEERAVETVPERSATKRADRVPRSYTVVRAAASVLVLLVAAAGGWLLVDAGAVTWVLGLVPAYLDFLWPFN